MRNKIPMEARRGFAINKAYEFLNEFKKLTLPINLYDMCAFHDITLMSYSDLKNHQGDFEKSRIATEFKKLPKDGFALMYDNTPYILYNEKARYKRRIRFTIAHEIGHIILGHFDDFDLTILNRTAVNTEQYDVLEEEADNFARNILTPYPFLKHIQLDKDNRWREYFLITNKAAETRKSFINMDKNLVLHEVRKTFKEKFEDLITLPLFLKKCARCKSITTLKNADFCICCGSNKLTKTYPKIGDVDMKYPGVSHTNGKMDVCPICSNEEIIDGAKHCNQCGVFLLNHCSDHDFSYSDGVTFNCETSLPYNSRHCHICGNESTFLKYGLLKSWQVEQNIQETKELDKYKNNQPIADDHLDDEDDILPF